MEIEIIIDGKKKVFRSKEITFKVFRKGTEILPKFSSGEFMGDGYPMEELDEAVDLIVDYFGNQFTLEQFYDGFMMDDALDFIVLFKQVLMNIQMNNGKRKMLEEVGKHKAQKQA